MSVAPDLLSRLFELPNAERAEIARQLILSLEAPDFDPDADAQWDVEIQARSASIDRGTASGADWRESIARMRAGLKAGAGLESKDTR